MNDPAHVSCKQAHDLLFAFLEGELPSETAAALQTHLGLCARCEEFVAGYRKTPLLCRAALDAEVPPEVTAQLKAFLRKKLPR